MMLWRWVAAILATVCVAGWVVFGWDVMSPTEVKPVNNEVTYVPVTLGPDGETGSCEEVVLRGAEKAESLVTHPPGDLRSHFVSCKKIAEKLRRCHVWEKNRQGKAKGNTPFRKIWIDLGSRELDVTTNFEAKYPSAKEFVKYCFEPNPKFKSLYDARPDIGYMPFAVSIVNETVELSNASVGSSIIDTVKRSQTGLGSFTVRSINFPQWLRDHTTPNDFVVVKMDIESAEFSVLHHLLRTSLITRIDELLLECHYKVSRSRNVTIPGEPLPISRYECKDLVHTIELAGVTAVSWNKKNYHSEEYAKKHGGFRAT